MILSNAIYLQSAFCDSKKWLKLNKLTDFSKWYGD